MSRISITKYILVFLYLLLMAILSSVDARGAVLSDPGVPDGEQIVWRWTRPDDKPTLSIVTWRVKDVKDRCVYEISVDSGERKQGKYIIDKSDLRLIRADVAENVKEGKYKVTIEVRDGNQYLIQEFKNKRKEKNTECHSDGYDGIALPFSLRGFPFGKRNEVKLRITPPFKPGVPFWAWRMWESYAKFLGEEKVTVPAGSFDCYKLEVAASGGLIKRVTSKYYFWFKKEPPHHFVKYQDEDGVNVTELMEIRSEGSVISNR